VREWNVLGEDTWSAHSRTVDYRIGVDLKPHRAHPNHVFFVYDGDADLDDVSRDPRLGSDEASTFEPGGLIYAAYVKNLNAYHAISIDGGIAYDTNFTGGSSIGRSGTVTLGRVGPAPPGC